MYGIQEVKGPRQEHKRWWDDITENVFERGHWTWLAQDRIQGWDLVIMVVNVSCAWKEGNFYGHMGDNTHYKDHNLNVICQI